MNSDIVGMTKARKVRDEVRAAIAFRESRPMEEQFIDSDAFGSQQPVTYDVKGQKIEIHKLHRVGLRCTDVMGADLFYEIPRVKFVLIQYKSPNSQGRVTLDDEQLRTLQHACPRTCPPSSRFQCGSWYAVRSTSHNAYFPACEAAAVFAPYQSRQLSTFINGLTMPAFHKDFRMCRLGARTDPVDVAQYRSAAITEDRVFVHARRLSEAARNTAK